MIIQLSLNSPFSKHNLVRFIARVTCILSCSFKLDEQ